MQRGKSAKGPPTFADFFYFLLKKQNNNLSAIADKLLSVKVFSTLQKTCYRRKVEIREI